MEPSNLNPKPLYYPAEELLDTAQVYGLFEENDVTWGFGGLGV